MRIKSITINPASIIFTVVAIVLVANGTISIWVPILIWLSEFKTTFKIPLGE